ncbi:MAG: mevalonate kinase [Saprospiraceae bacterium]|nr:mevalonate kinase [Saprospiraceae bacterium]
MTDIHKKYNAKILLFGEYTVTLGSGALAIPYDEYSGYWDFGAGHESSKHGLRKLAEFVSHSPELNAKYNLTAFYEALENGLYFNSNIPSGYGLGSSGAVVAAFYDTYSYSKNREPVLLKHELSLLESAFHGASSGIDPLVSLLNVPILIDDQYEITTLKIDKIDYNMFLHDTGISRQTGPLVSLFKSKLENDNNFKNAVEQLSAINKAAIQSYIMGDRISLFIHFDWISKIQYDFFSEMIPEPFRKLWKTGLDSDTFKLKLCGAGGGGYLMGIVKDQNIIPEELSGFNTSFFI